MHSQMKTGTYTGDGAAQNIEIGWTPDHVEIFNVTDGDVSWNWFSSMTDGHALQNTNHDTAQQSRITSNGVSAYAGSSTPGSEKRKGFTIGTSLSESGKVFAYRASRNLP